MSGRAQRVVPWVGLGAVLAVIGYLLINTTFMLYDDEGYVLQTTRDFLGGHRLYDEVFSQYGPWPFVYQQLAAKLAGGTLTHTLGRGLTLLHWIGTVVLCGALVARLTGRTLAGLVTAAATFGLLWQVTQEPSHPGSAICLLLSVAAVAAAAWPRATAPAACAGLLGVIAGLLLLTKVNVGLFFAAGLGAAVLRFTAWPERWRRPASLAATAGLLLLPWALMARQLGDPWALQFALQFSLGAAGLVWVTPSGWTGRPLAPRHALVAAAAALAAAGLVTAAVLLQGTSPAAFVDAVLLRPLRHPASFMFGFTWGRATWPVAALAALLTARAGWELRHHGRLSPRTDWLVLAARGAAVVAFAFHAKTWLTIYGVGGFITVCLPLAPLFVMPVGGRGWQPAALAERWMLALVALPQVLHAFPVAGSQMGWGTFLLVPLFATGLLDALPAEGAAPRGRRLRLAVEGALALVVAAQLWLLGSTGWERYRESRPLDLPGAADIRVSEVTRQALRTLTLNAAIHADVLFSRPGMFSFNLWSGVATPTTENATHWFWLLDAPAQQRILDRLAATPRSAVVTYRPLDDFLRQVKVPMAGPLVDLIRDRYRPLFSIGDYQFLLPAGTAAVPFGLAEHLPAPGEPGRALLRSNIVLAARPAAVRLVEAADPFATQLDCTAAGYVVRLEPINHAGQKLGPAVAPAEVPAKGGLFRLSVTGPDLARDITRKNLLLVLLDAEGRVLSESAF